MAPYDNINQPKDPSKGVSPSAFNHSIFAFVKHNSCSFFSILNTHTHTHTHNLFLSQILRCPQHPIVSTPSCYATPMVPRSIILFCLSKSAAQLRVWRVCGVFCAALLRQKITISPRNKLLQESKVVSSSPTRGRITYIHCLCRTYFLKFHHALVHAPLNSRIH